MPVLSHNHAQPVELIIGPYRSGKTDRLLRDLLAFARKNPLADTIVMVPSARIAALVGKRLLGLLQESLKSESHFKQVEISNKCAHQCKPQTGAQEPDAGYFGVRILSFYQICQLVLQKAGQPFSVAGDNIRLALLSRSIDKLQNQGAIKTIAPIAGFKGTHRAVLNLIDELQRAALSPDQVLKLLAASACRESKLTDLARLYQDYSDELEQAGLRDQHLLAFKVSEVLNQTVQNRLPLNFDWLLVDGFDRFNPLQLQVLKGLSKYCRQMNIAFDFIDPQQPSYEKHRQDYIWKERSYEQLLRSFNLTSDFAGLRYVNSALSVSPDAEPDASKAEGAEEAPGVKRLDARRASGTSPERLNETFSTLDRYLEMEEIARRCKKLICEGKAGSCDLLVVARDLSKYSQAAASAFENAGLPYFIDESVSIRQLPVIQFLCNLLTLSLNECKRASVISCLRSRYCRRDAYALTMADVDEIDNATLKSGLAGGISGFQSINLPSGGQRAQGGLSKFLQRISHPQGINTYGYFCAWVEDLIDELLSLSPWLEGPAGGKDADAIAAFAALRRIIAGLVEEENILGARLVDYDKFLARLFSAIDEANFRRAAKHKSAVTICGADYAPNCGFEHVFIAGLSEGEFPRRQSSSGFVSEGQLSLWSSFGVELENPRHHPAFEWGLYRTLLMRARAKAYLSFPRYEMGGNDELVPSFFVTAGQSEAEHAIPFLAPFLASAAEPVSARQALCGMLWSGGRQASAHLLKQAAVEELWNELSSPLAVAQARTSGPRESVYNGYLAEMVAAGRLVVPMQDSWSVTSLNDYGKCPLRFWLSRVLSLGRRQEPEPGVDMRLLGEVQHKALEFFYRTWRQRGVAVASIEEREWQPVLEESLGRAIAWLEQQPNFYPGPFWPYDKIEIGFRVKRFLKEDLRRQRKDKEPFEPELFEVSFGRQGDAGGYDALVLESGGTKIRLKGAVDRIDVCPAENGSNLRARVIDYKSSSASISAREARAGRNLQVPLYALATQRVILPGSRVAHGAYLSVGAARTAGRLDFEGKDHDILALVEEHVTAYVEGISKGDFTLRPNGADACRNCPHDRVCRIAELAPLAREEDDEQPD